MTVSELVRICRLPAENMTSDLSFEVQLVVSAFQTLDRLFLQMEHNFQKDYQIEQNSRCNEQENHIFRKIVSTN